MAFVRERAKAGSRPRQRGMSFGDAADAFQRHSASVGGARGAVAPTTLRGYRSVIAVLSAGFPPELPLAKVTSAAVERYQERLPAEVPGQPRATLALWNWEHQAAVWWRDAAQDPLCCNR
jgi:hypothetical protein